MMLLLCGNVIILYYYLLCFDDDVFNSVFHFLFRFTRCILALTTCVCVSCAAADVRFYK